MSIEPSIAAVVASLTERRNAIDRAITALLALDDSHANGAACSGTTEPPPPITLRPPLAVPKKNQARHARAVARLEERDHRDYDIFLRSAAGEHQREIAADYGLKVMRVAKIVDRVAHSWWRKEIGVGVQRCPLPRRLS